MFATPNLDGLSTNPADLREAARVFGLLQQYARHKATAMTERANGYVDIALSHEVECERLFVKLPAWAKW